MEAELDRFIEESPHNTQIARMFRMKAEWPEKYRENVKVAGLGPVREMLDRLTEMAARRLERERQELEQSSVEGQYREMGEEGHN